MRLQQSKPFHTMRGRVIICTMLMLVVAGLLGSPAALSHGKEIKIGAPGGPVQLTPAQQRKLDLKTAPASLRPVTELLNLNGEVRLVPGRQANVSTRINGQVTALYASLGDTVRSGQRLVRVQSRLVGNPPPSIDVAAPMAGVVDALEVSLGQAVEPATVLYRISDRSQVNMVARVYEEDLGKVQVGQQAKVRTLSYPDRIFPGKIILVGPTLDPQSRTVEVWIRLDNPDNLLKPNLFARAGIALRQSAASLTVPTAAIIEANGEKFVFIQQKDRYIRSDITAGASDGDFTEVTDGLVPGDVVVTQGNREIYTLWLTGGVLKGEDD